MRDSELLAESETGGGSRASVRLRSAFDCASLPGPALMTGLTWSGASPVAVWLQQQTNGEWGVWEPLPIGHATDHAGDFEGGQETEGEVSRRGTDAIVLAEPDAFRYLVEGSIDEGWAFIFADQPTTLRPQAAPSSSTAEVYWPGASFVRDRSEWDTTDCRIPDAEFNYSSSQAVIVHHTASSNAYSQSQVPALLRGLCAFQTGSRELDDLGYNFMVDRFGTVWEGRTGSKRAPITSAHARGFNHNTQGVALLGNYDAATPPPAFRR